MSDLTKASSLGLAEVDTFIAPAHLVSETVEFLRRVGAHGAEGFVLWSGQRERKSIFRFTSAHVPEQHAYGTEDGLLVIVKGDALFKLNKKLYEIGEILGAQVHSHPTSAYHSDTDDHFPLVTLVGALSIVIPDFAVHAPDDKDDWAVYRLRRYGEWAPVDENTNIIFEQ